MIWIEPSGEPGGVTAAVPLKKGLAVLSGDAGVVLRQVHHLGKPGVHNFGALCEDLGHRGYPAGTFSERARFTPSYNRELCPQ